MWKLSWYAQSFPLAYLWFFLSYVWFYWYGVFYSFGIHPRIIAKECNSQLLLKLQDLKKYSRCVGIREVGLDYLTTDIHNVQAKKYWFSKILEIAKTTGLPITIHCRNKGDEQQAFVDCFEMMKRHLDPFHPIYLHCFFEKFRNCGYVIELLLSVIF